MYIEWCELSNKVYYGTYIKVCLLQIMSSVGATHLPQCRHHSHPGGTLQEILSPLPAWHDSEDAHSLEAGREEFY